MERDGRLHTKIGMASRFREDSPVNELVMHKQKVMPGCGFPYADLPQAGRLRRSCMFVRFPPTISCVAKVAGRRVDHEACLAPWSPAKKHLCSVPRVRI
jgi:hypothetical protein